MCVNDAVVNDKVQSYHETVPSLCQRLSGDYHCKTLGGLGNLSKSIKIHLVFCFLCVSF